VDIDKCPETTATRGDIGPVRIERLCYNPEPDYTQPLYELPGNTRAKMLARLRRLYGEAKAREALPELERVLKVHYAHKPPPMKPAHPRHYQCYRLTDCGGYSFGGNRVWIHPLHRSADRGLLFSGRSDTWAFPRPF
jgi:hypothetical protein